MKKIIKLSESDLYRIVNRILNEDNKTTNPKYLDKIRRDNYINPTVATNARGEGEGYYKSNVGYTTTQSFSFSKDQIETGSDQVKKETPEYKRLVIAMNNTPSPKDGKKYKMTITGGASAVGSSSGYDNKALAKRRADKLVQSLSQDVSNINNKFNITTSGVVGTSTKLNSAEAYKEQFVNIKLELPKFVADKSFIESDNTVTTHGGGLPYNDPNGGGGITDSETTICVTLPKRFKNALIKLLYDLKSENNINLTYVEENNKFSPKVKNPGNRPRTR